MNIELNAGNVKAAMREAQAVSSDLWKVPLDQIHIIAGFNVRSNAADHKAHVDGLTESILANGFYASKPLSGYVALEDDKQIIYLTDGHCRLEAVHAAIRRGAEIHALPVVVSPKGTSLEDLTVALVTSNSGKPLTPYEVGIVCKRLTGFGWDEKQIAAKLCMTVQRVGGLLDLIGAPKAVRDLVVAGTVSATQAIETLKRHGPTAGDKLQAGAEKARATGKAKATKKHIDDKPTCRAVVKALLQWDKTQCGGLPEIIKMARAALA